MQKSLLRKEVQELSYILVKLASIIKQTELSVRISSLSCSLVENLYAEEYRVAGKRIESIIGLSALACNIGEINSNTADILIKRCRALSAKIQDENKARNNLLDLPNYQRPNNKIYTGDERAEHSNPKPGQLSLGSFSQESRMAREAINTPNIGSGKNSNSISKRAEKRQNRILAIMRQAENGKLQLKNIIATFPDYSDRTIRYDLEKLCERGIIYREGSGGPSNYYVLTDQPQKAPEYPLPPERNGL
ncbi:MAG: hypothetical protein COU09_02595 [Candidatus Harrisonbacteria bacterium CG10_big_fil_rev_8_21_14_0_10_44_23]|uniref:HTH deoR-type domain-containing protein n=1 Tax=Candidatus Harrisonbacteria bacterium CG10_big_fil_rev_8_21_14_0_10_44_23 TaxID=1974585 RepID=A0A2H0UPM2_9BACT|nr:MAG: hypothetical protein COU09_02595 [Candidatus Harrisonbacteria bacterium CG10_big_fil_rev_8_21_14_0_10_44_23]